MTRSWIRLSATFLVCGTVLIAASAADPKKPTGESGQPAEPTPVDQSPMPAEGGVPAESGQTPIVPVSEQAEDKGPWEVTDRMELVFRDPFAVKGDKTLMAKVQLKNKSEEDIAGKLVLVIDGSSLEGTRLEDSQGQFTETTPYLQIVPAKRTLDAGQLSAVKPLILSSENSLKDVKASDVTLRWRAYTLTKPADLNDDPPKDAAKVPGKAYTWGEMRKVMAVSDRVTPGLVQQHNGAIIGAGTSENENGQLVLRVFAARGGMSRKLPGEIEGIPVEVSVSGEIKAGPSASRAVVDNGGQKVLPEADKPETADAAKSTVSGNANATVQIGPPTRRFLRPVPIGVSSMNQTDICATGTLGCRCRGRDGTLYVLSNCHVYGEENLGTVGDPIVQPGQLDAGCLILPTDVIANLRAFQRISFFTSAATFPTAPVNIMDAAIGETPIGQVDVCTPKEGYGTPSRTPLETLYPGLAVQKLGRTTGYTKGKITTLNSEALINYGAAGFARFKSCIVVQTATRLPAFGGPGDSGSLVVTLKDRRPLGILFAGGGFDTFLNPISPVLHRFNVGVDDGTGAAPVLGSGRMGTASGPVRQHINVTPF